MGAIHVDQNTMEVGVPKFIYETLEDILEVQIRSLVNDIAKTLNVNEKLLIKELKKEKIKIYLYDDQSDACKQCKSFVLAQNGFYIPCDQPVAHPKDVCPTHLENPILKTLDDKNTLITLNYGKEKYYRDRINNVFTLESNKPIGFWKPSKQEIISFKTLQ